jgi:hypothetical protein
MNVLVALLLLGSCWQRYKERTPTRHQAIEQAQQYDKLKKLEMYADSIELIYITRQKDSLKRIKNPYKYIR